MDKKGFILLSAFLLLINSVTAQSGLNLYDSNIDLQDNNLTNPNEIKNFFDSACGQDSAVAQVYSNGSYSCVDIPDLEKQNLSEVLAEGNVANQSINMSGSNLESAGNLSLNGSGWITSSPVGEGNDIRIKPSQYSGEDYSGDLVLEGGLGPSDNGNIGGAGGDVRIAAGTGTGVSSDGSILIGYNDALNIGLGTSNPDTFVDIEGGKLDLSDNNITGVSNLEGFFDQDQCGDSEAVKTVYPNGSYACNSISTDQTVENLSETLAAGNVANQTIRFDSNTGVRLGDSSTSTALDSDVAIGKGAATAGTPDSPAVAIGDGSSAGSEAALSVGEYAQAGGIGSIAIGSDEDNDDTGASAADFRSVALGSDANSDGVRALALGAASSASAEKAVAIGYQANAPNKNEATFGNLDDDRLDLNVTGNATIHQDARVKDNLEIGGRSVSQSGESDPVIDGSADVTGPYEVRIKDDVAFVVSNEGDYFAVFDVSNSSNPVKLDEVTDPALSGPWGLDIVGDRAYVGSYTGDSLTVIDISDPSDVGVLGSISSSSDLNGASRVEVVNDIAYVTATDGNSLTTVDVSNPQNLKVVDSVTSTADLEGPGDVEVVGDTAFVGARLSDALTTVDVSDPSDLSIRGTVSSTQDLYGAGSLEISGIYAYVAGFDGDSLAVVNVSDPENPEIEGSVSSSELGGAYGMDMAGDYAYVGASTSDAVTVVDVSDKDSPEIVSSVSSTSELGTPEGVEIDGGKAYIAAKGSDKITVMDIPGLDTPSANIGNLQTSDLHVQGDSIVDRNLKVQGGLNVGPRGISSQGDTSVNGDLEVKGEAAFGTENQPSNVNVTGNLTVEGEEVDASGGDVTNADTVESDRVETQEISSTGRMCIGDRC
jgi:hypothetical protein